MIRWKIECRSARWTSARRRIWRRATPAHRIIPFESPTRSADAYFVRACSSLARARASSSVRSSCLPDGTLRPPFSVGFGGAAVGAVLAICGLGDVANPGRDQRSKRLGWGDPRGRAGEAERFLEVARDPRSHEGVELSWHRGATMTAPSDGRTRAMPFGGPTRSEKLRAPSDGSATRVSSRRSDRVSRTGLVPHAVPRAR